MSTNSDEFFVNYHNRMAPKSRRQMPIFAQVGKGPKGDEYRLSIEGSGLDTSIVCTYTDNATGDQEQLWGIPLASIAPQFYYTVYQGVRDLEGVPWLVYYMNIRCVMEYDGEAFDLWSFTTPPTFIRRFGGGTVPPDHATDTNDPDVTVVAD